LNLISIMTKTPDVTFKTRVDGDWADLTTAGIFAGKRVVVFSLPGAFTPTCSSYQLPGYEAFYDMIREQGVDEVYCISVNDSFVMNAWFKDQGITKVKAIPDGSGEFTHAMGMSVCKTNLGFGFRSWRYSMIVNDGEIETLFEEPGKIGNCPTDPYEVSDPDTMLTHLKSNA